MGPDPTENIDYYERLIFKHALRVASFVEMDFDDIVQTYRIKVWDALEAFKRDRWGDDKPDARQRFVFQCLKNKEKDILKRKRRGELYIEDLAPASGVGGSAGLQSRDHFDARYLAAGHEQTFGEVEEDLPLIPSTLTAAEREIVVRLYRDHTQAEIRRDLGMERSEMDRTVKSIRTKFSDWRPSTPAEIAEPEVALAVAA